MTIAFMKKPFFLILILCIFGCTKEEVAETEIACFQKAFLEPFTMEPGQCVTLKELPDKTFTLLRLGSAKKEDLFVPAAPIAYSLQEISFYQEWGDISINEDYQQEGTSFSGRFHITADGNVPYTVFIDDIEFTETETEYIFHKLTLRFSEYDPEF